LRDADALDRDGFVSCRLVIRERGCSLMLVSILSLALTLAQYVHAQTVRTRSVQLRPGLHCDDFTPIDGGPRRGSSMLGRLLGGPMLHSMPTPSPGRLSNSSSMEICRALLCNRSYPRDDGAQALCTLDARVFIPPTLSTPASDERRLGQSASCLTDPNGTSAVNRRVYFLPM
jgi:hypothetical protein